ncbi:MAG TPA: hypothetical protein VGX28_08995 [Frankiaceae bacterium]|nr:hypothetical protein [Frankiaceae bacterium]
MKQSDWKAVLDVVAPAALEHLESLPERRVYPLGDHAEIRAALDRPPKVLVRWLAPDGDHGALAERVMAGVRGEGVAFFSGTTYRGERLMRIAVSDWATDEADVDRVVEALLRHAEPEP